MQEVKHMKIAKKFHKIKSINKLNKWIGIVGLALLLFAVYFLFTKGYNQMFLLGTTGLTLLGESGYLIYRERKCGAIGGRSFVRVSDCALSILLFVISIFMFYMQEIGSAIFCFVISVLLVLTVLFTKNVTEEKFLELYEKYIDK